MVKTSLWVLFEKPLVHMSCCLKYLLKCSLFFFTEKASSVKWGGGAARGNMQSREEMSIENGWFHLLELQNDCQYCGQGCWVSSNSVDFLRTRCVKAVLKKIPTDWREIDIVCIVVLILSGSDRHRAFSPLWMTLNTAHTYRQTQNSIC